MNDVILYTTEDGRSQIKLRAQEQTVWLTQREMAELFDAGKQNIALHLKNIFEDGALDPVATVKEFLTVQFDTRRVANLSASFREPNGLPIRDALRREWSGLHHMLLPGKTA